MIQPLSPDPAANQPRTEDPLDAALAAAFGSAPQAILGESVLTVLRKDGQPSAQQQFPKHDGRYELLEEIARGGMGVVHRGRDADLSRTLAVKILQERHAGDPSKVQRFIEEAQIGGQLQHPGIVPVFDMGLLADRRPFFTMKLVQGMTLADLLATRSDPSQQRSRFLNIFHQVCQTIAYAHSRAVIHRDLKPDNIMVGAFGEVLVMDWGLAKVLTGG